VEGVAEINKPKRKMSPCLHNIVCTKLAHRSVISTHRASLFAAMLPLMLSLWRGSYWWTGGWVDAWVDGHSDLILCVCYFHSFICLRDAMLN